MPSVLLATSIGPGKEHFIPLLLSTVPQLEGVCSVLVTLDGVEPPDELPESWWKHHLEEPESALSIHGRLARMREAQRRFFLAGKWDYLYWHDSDMIPPADIVPRLISRAAGIAAGLYNRRGNQDICLCVFARFGQRPGEELGDTVLDEVEVVDGAAQMAGAGTGAMLVRRDVLEKFGFRDPSWYPPEGPGEDVRWCMDLNEAGIPVVVDWTAGCWHVNDDGIGTRPALQGE